MKYVQLEGMALPKHIAIIMDGNGRWAKQRGKKRTFGHKSGSDNLKKIAKVVSDMGVKYLTVYAFSTENWKRPKEEINYLMLLIRQYLKESIKNAKKDNMRVRVIGKREGLDQDICASIEALEVASKDHTGLNLQIAINYGGRDEIVRAIKTYEEAKKLDEKLILTEEKFSQYLDTKNIPDPELMIRTSGEIRVSNFLLWQFAYTEYYFIDKHWPDFTEEDLVESIIFLNSRNHKFGGIENED